LLFSEPSASNLCIMDSSFKRTCFQDLGTGSFETGKNKCQALGGHLPVVTKSSSMSFLANKFEGNIWMSLKTDRLVLKTLTIVVQVNLLLFFFWGVGGDSMNHHCVKND
jgi:hypothetical protein